MEEQGRSDSNCLTTRWARKIQECARLRHEDLQEPFSVLHNKSNTISGVVSPQHQQPSLLLAQTLKTGDTSISGPHIPNLSPPDPISTAVHTLTATIT